MSGSLPVRLAHQDFTLLLQKARGGCRDSLGVLLGSCSAYLKSILAARAVATAYAPCSPDSVRDLIQETYFLAIKSFTGFHGQTHIELRTWLRSILVHRAADYQAARAHRPVQLESTHERAGQNAPDALADQRERSNRLHDAMAQLPIVYREVLNLHFFDRLSWQAIGKHLGKTANAARMLNTRAMGRLSLILHPRGVTV